MNILRKDVALIVSISLNVFFLGAAITVYALHGFGAPALGGQRSSMRSAASGLDVAHRAAFMRLLHAQGQTIQAETRSARAIRDIAWGSLAKADFDPLITKRRLAQARDLNVRAHSTLEDAVVDFATGLTPAQRAIFSQTLRRAAARQRADTARDRPNAR